MVSKKVVILVVVIFLLLITEIGAFWLIRNHYVGSMNRYELIEQDTFRSIHSQTLFGYDEEYTANFRLQIADLFPHPVEEFTIEEAIAIREALLDQSSRKYGQIKIEDPIKLLKALQKGKKLICGDLACLYAFTLHSLGFAVRQIGISRSIFNPWDSHAIVEIWDEKRNKWILTDPTFDLSLMKDEQYLSSDEVFDLIHSGQRSAIKFKEGIKTAYEYSLKDYYISYFSLFDNLYYYSYMNPQPHISHYPPLRWFDDRFVVKMVTTVKHPVRGNAFRIQNAIILFVILIIPSTLIALFLLLVLFILCKVILGRKPSREHSTIEKPLAV